MRNKTAQNAQISLVTLQPDPGPRGAPSPARLDSSFAPSTPFIMQEFELIIIATGNWWQYRMCWETDVNTQAKSRKIPKNFWKSIHTPSKNARKYGRGSLSN